MGELGEAAGGGVEEEHLPVAVRILAGQVRVGGKGDAGPSGVKRGDAAVTDMGVSDLSEAAGGGVEEEELVVAGRIVPGQVRIGEKGDAGPSTTDRGISTTGVPNDVGDLGEGAGGGVEEEDLIATDSILAGQVRVGGKGDTGPRAIDHRGASGDAPSPWCG